MQLILDAEDIDIKRNMSTIEHESLNEKFLNNKIIEHLADDICSGNKENIQKQNNVISEEAEDVLDTDKDNTSKHDVILTNNLNGENSKQNIETDNVENSKGNEINNIITDPIPECDQDIKNVNKEILQADKNESVLEEPDKISAEPTENEKKLNITTVEKVVDCEPTADADDDVILDNNEGDTGSPVTKEANSIILDNTAEENESSGEIETDDPIILDCNALNNGSSLKEEDVAIPDHIEKKEPLILNEIINPITVNNAANNEIDSFVNPDNATDDKSMAVKEADSVLSLDDAAADNSSLLFQETDSTAKAKPMNVEEIKTDKVSDKTVDKDFDEISSQNKISNLQSSNSKEMNSMQSNSTVKKVGNINPNANENNTTIEIDDEDVKISDDNCESSAQIQEGDVEMKEKDEKDVDNCKSAQKNFITETPSVVTSEPKRICKLSNNLDIFSDEEEEENSPKPTEVEPPINNTLPPTEKESISVEDDDEIMVIDEDSNVKDCALKDESKIASDKIESLPDSSAKNEEVFTEITTNSTAVDDNSISEKDTSAAQETPAVTTTKPDTESCNSADKIEETQPKVNKPLLPKNFIKSYKKNLADMTRDELEEFCILKIVESIVDRSNLGEIKSQLKNLTQTMEECKKKCLILSKQNKDLQVVLKSVQEEQKSASDVHITPLKITRSVGMQVVMTVDKNNMRKKTTNGVSSPISAGANPANNKAGKSPLPATNTKNERKANSPQIPVPRLVPAVPAVKTNQMPTINNSPKQVSNNPIPNGLRVVTPVAVAKVAEKRSRSQSITVDLTDDEPPAKQQTVQRNIVNQGVRMVTPQQPNLIAAQRFGQNINSPRKVYIPISGQAQNIRPAQTIMLKPVPGLHPRQRCPPTHAAKVPQAASPARLGRIAPQRHPAPLPEAPKQYQPPNWKTLPPAPDLKLSKVENGIVISWKIDNYNEDNHEVIASYQLYAYQETQSPPSTSLWKKIGDVKALPLPMACTLTQFMAGYKYYFAVRAVDVRSRFGPFSLPGSILLLNKM